MNFKQFFLITLSTIYKSNKVKTEWQHELHKLYKQTHWCTLHSAELLALSGNSHKNPNYLFNSLTPFGPYTISQLSHHVRRFTLNISYITQNKEKNQCVSTKKTTSYMHSIHVFKVAFLLEMERMFLDVRLHHFVAVSKALKNTSGGWPPLSSCFPLLICQNSHMIH